MAQKKKMAWQQIVATVFLLCVGAACGYFVAMYADQILPSDVAPGAFLLWCGTLLLLLYAAVFLQLILHEAGHLLFGLASGYRFSSFRIGSMMWIRQNSKTSTCR